MQGKVQSARLTVLAERGRSADDEGRRTGVHGGALGFPDRCQTEAEVLGGRGLIVQHERVRGESHWDGSRLFEGNMGWDL